MKYLGKCLVLVAGIAGVTVIECYAISRGIDGTALAGSMGAIGLIAGYVFGKKKTA
jgi:hypothetical protein